MLRRVLPATAAIATAASHLPTHTVTTTSTRSKADVSQKVSHPYTIAQYGIREAKGNYNEDHMDVDVVGPEGRGTNPNYLPDDYQPTDRQLKSRAEVKRRIQHSQKEVDAYANKSSQKQSASSSAVWGRHEKSVDSWKADGKDKDQSSMDAKLQQYDSMRKDLGKKGEEKKDAKVDAKQSKSKQDSSARSHEDKKDLKRGDDSQQQHKWKDQKNEKIAQKDGAGGKDEVNLSFNKMSKGGFDRESGKRDEGSYQREAGNNERPQHQGRDDQHRGGDVVGRQESKEGQKAGIAKGDMNSRLQGEKGKPILDMSVQGMKLDQMRQEREVDEKDDGVHPFKRDQNLGGELRDANNIAEGLRGGKIGLEGEGANSSGDIKARQAPKEEGAFHKKDPVRNDTRKTAGKDIPQDTEYIIARDKMNGTSDKMSGAGQLQGAKGGYQQQQHHNQQQQSQKRNDSRQQPNKRK